MVTDKKFKSGVWYDFELASDYCDYMTYRYDVILAKTNYPNGSASYRLIYKQSTNSVYPWYDVSGDDCYPTSKFDEFMIIPL